MRSAGRFALVFALGPWMASFAVLAPEHVHAADARHPHAVAHRHVEAHDQDQTEIEPGHGRVLWLSGDVAVHCAVYQLTVGPAAVSAVVTVAPAFNAWMLAAILDGSPPHGPPLPYTPLRAPPLLAA